MALDAVERGTGHPIVLVHGSAADRTAWNIQLSLLAKQLRVIAYDRRPGVTTVAEHADDLAKLIAARSAAPAI